MATTLHHHIKHYQNHLEKKDTSNKQVLDAINKLHKLPVTVQLLQDTGVGRTVNSLRKGDSDIAYAARSLISKWKSMVTDEEQEIERKQREAIAFHSEAAYYEDASSSSDHDDSIEGVQRQYSSDQSEDESDRIREEYKRREKNRRELEQLKEKERRRHKRKHEADYEDHDDGWNKKRRIEIEEPKHSRIKKYESSEASDNDDKSNSSDAESCGNDKKTVINLSDNSDVDGSKMEDKESDNENYYNKSDNDDVQSPVYTKQMSDRDEYNYRASKLSESSTDAEEEVPKQQASKLSYPKSSSHDRESKYDKHHSSRDHKSKHRSSSKHESSHHKHRESSNKHSSSKPSHKTEESHKSLKDKHINNDKHSSDKSSKDKNSDNSKCSNSKDKSKDRHKERHSDKHGSNEKEKSKRSHKEKHSESKVWDKKSESKDKDKKSESSGDKRVEQCKEKKSESKDRSHKSESKDKSKHQEQKHKSSHQSSKHKSHSAERESSSKRENNKEHSKSEKKEHKSDRKRDSKHSSSSKKSSSKSKSKESSDEYVPEAKKKKIIGDFANGIDAESGASFAEALGMISPSKSSLLPKKKSYSQKSSGHSDSDNFQESKNTHDEFTPSLLKPSAKLAPLSPLKVSISALPDISPNYVPRPAPKLLEIPQISEEEAMSVVMNTKNQRTKVYSGNKATHGKVPSLYDLCVYVLQENINALEYTGGVPYGLLKPVIVKATPEQLYVLEDFNPYLIEDTDSLWKEHCNKRFKGKARQEFESWRDMYLRCLDEQEAKLKSLTANIKMAQDKSQPVRQTKMAYVDSVVKPPRAIARKQAIYGTARKAIASPAARVPALANSTVFNAATAVNVAAPSTSSRPVSTPHIKPKKAPLMAKVIQSLRGRNKR